MNKFTKKVKILSFVFLIWIIAVIIPKIFISDIADVSTQDKECAHEFIYQHLDNPLQRMAIIKIAIDYKEGDIFTMGLYSLFGLRCGAVHLVCDSWARTVFSDDSPSWCT